VHDSGPRRTFGIWGFVALFVAMGLAGVVALLVIGTGSPRTEQLDPPQSLPEDWEEAASSTTEAPSTSGAQGATAAPGAETEVTTPDGWPAPDGVDEVLVEGELVSYVFAPPPDLERDGLEPVVAPMGVAVTDGGAAVELTIGCARSPEEFLAQVAVTEASDTITFVAIALAPRDGAPCAQGATPFRMEVPLRDPVGDRSVVVVPPGASVPDLDTA
jgi:hypothetical protein